ncbi:hypothetical protein BD769DRAFT_1417176 [Suillus cothurnatus]|nr:hypothetical protein BD769DRAFT_1417130 [Suillus cothurnatus]KAG2145683.1 hypothetical protein BD769DRAFT_1417176 [Suillus cothurnatus]
MLILTGLSQVVATTASKSVSLCVCRLETCRTKGSMFLCHNFSVKRNSRHGFSFSSESFLVIIHSLRAFEKMIQREPDVENFDPYAVGLDSIKFVHCIQMIVHDISTCGTRLLPAKLSLHLVL